MNLNKFIIYPAIHLRNGEVVRFTQGEQVSPIFGVSERAYRIDELLGWLKKRGYKIEKHYGIRCVYNYWGSNEQKQEAETYEKLKKLEFALTDRDPYKQTARLFQLILRKNG